MPCAVYQGGEKQRFCDGIRLRTAVSGSDRDLCPVPQGSAHQSLAPAAVEVGTSRECSIRASRIRTARSLASGTAGKMAMYGRLAAKILGASHLFPVAFS
jgi:hypothetical protein